jgi:hypothetical protein
MRVLLLLVSMAAVGVGWAGAQDDACASPKSARIGILIAARDPDKIPDKSASKASAEAIATLRREFEVESRFRDALIRKMAGVCVVREGGIFKDAQNYPELKGSMLIQIVAQPSAKNPKVAAVSVTLGATQGPQADQNFQLGQMAVLIEDDADYEEGVKAFLKYWTLVGTAMQH